MRHFLSVEDEANRRMVYQPTLEANGYVIVEAGSDPKALQVSSREEMNVMVSGGGLPDIGGLQLLSGIQLQPKYDQIYDDFYDWEAEAFGVKPADLLELQGALAWSFQPQTRDAASKRCSRI